tara:strand:- start:5756 stop:6433 length:678 start_codon:yes stop_codon:yes gene_type:complete
MRPTNKLTEYIIEQQAQRREYSLFGAIPFIIKDFATSDEVDYPSLINNIEEILPKHLLNNIEMVYMGDFPFLEDRNAIYSDGAIYLTNEEPTNYDILENFVHEVAHAIEDISALLASDEGVRGEFLAKRKRLKSILDYEGYEIPGQYYTNTQYSEDFDRFLSEVVGYPTLLMLTMGLFVSPYGATSLEEYFANSFENYYLNSRDEVKTISPRLYELITTLHDRSL